MPHSLPNTLRTLALVAVAALLGSCATLSEEECKTADWGRLGLQDGAAGYPESRLAEHAEACAKVGIRPLADIWRAGWDQGVLRYCTPQVGWNEGLAGRGYQGVCQGRNEGAFLQAYRAGSEIHRLQSRIDSTYQELRHLDGQLAAAPNDEARRRLRERMRYLDQELVHLRMSLSLQRLQVPRY